MKTKPDFFLNINVEVVILLKHKKENISFHKIVLNSNYFFVQEI